MAIKLGDYVIVLYDSNLNPIGFKSNIAKSQDELLILAISSDNIPIPISVTSMKYINDIGFRGKDSNDNPVGLITSRETFIGMCWIDEAQPGYTGSQTTYEAGINLFKTSISKIRKWSASCQNPGNSSSTNVWNNQYPESYGIPIYMETIGRPPTSIQLTSRFDYLLQSFQSQIPISIEYPTYLILSVDVSGSMNLNTIQPAYNDLKNYVNVNYPQITIIETTFSNESWLHIWASQISDIV